MWQTAPARPSRMLSTARSTIADRVASDADLMCGSAMQAGMMMLISMAMVVAFVTSWAGTLGLFEVEI